MYNLKRTHARTVFKDLLGQANHFLITILIGLSAVREGTAKLDEEFRTSWNPQDVQRSAERSRQFALDLALIRAVDALDTYMMLVRRHPTALANPDFARRMDGTGQSVAKRLKVFSEFLPALHSHQLLFLKLAIDWRNQRVHSLSDEKLTSEEDKELLQNSELFRKSYRGLEMAPLLLRYKRAESPSFKDAASIIRLAHEAVEHFDQHLLGTLDIEGYVRGLISLMLSTEDSSGKGETSLKRACAKTWGQVEKRRTKDLRILRMVGVHPTSNITGRLVPESFVEKIAVMTPDEAFNYLSGC